MVLDIALGIVLALVILVGFQFVVCVVIGIIESIFD
jgi:hypothetical protein